MLRLTPEPRTGIDAPLAKIQREMFERLRGVWGLSEADWECYGRVQRIRAAGGSYIARAYRERGEEVDAFHDDERAVVSFFGVGSTSPYAGGRTTSSLHLVLFVNLSRLKPHAWHRADEEARSDVRDYFRQNATHGLLPRFEIVTGIENVLAEYPGSIRDKMDSKADTGQYHAFRINLTINY